MAHNNDEPIISSLVKSRDEVKKLVTAQIEAAETVLNINVQGQEVVEVLPFGGRGAHWVYDKEQKEAFDAAYRQWDDYNKELFARIFADSNNTDRKKYIQAGEKMCYSGHEDFVAESKKTIRGKVVYMSVWFNDFG